MNVDTYIASLVQYGLDCGLLETCDRIYVTNQLLQVLGLDSYTPAEPENLPLEETLKGLLDDAVARGICGEDITSRDLFDTKLMGILTPAPREVRKKFASLYRESPKAATDWYYQFSQDTDYIRRYRIQKDMRWKTDTEYGALDITINLSKPEKDPKAIAAAKNAPQSGYPKCLLCVENEGYAGRMNHPARQNHRIIPLEIAGQNWFLQYSPYVYYNEHCIAFNSAHTPMKIDRSAFEKLLDFVTVFPHYFIGSNADLPIVGGSILSHEHFQGGHYCFPMEQAPVEREITFRGFKDVKAGLVKWPMSVIRLDCPDKERLVELADKILKTWRGYSDEEAFIFAESDGEPHNTITPIARRRGEDYELDLVLRNNRTTPEHPLGLFHPHGEYHHIKKENIGLIEVMGLAILPPRLLTEAQAMEEALADPARAEEIMARPEMEKHRAWYEELKAEKIRPENAEKAVKDSIGEIFGKILGNAGVYKDTEEGRAAFLRFCQSV